MRLVSIGSVVEKVNSWDPRRSAYTEFTYVDLASVDRDTKSVSSYERIPTADAPSRARQLVRRGDVLVSTVRPNLNAVASISGALDGATASTGFCVLRPRGPELNDRYLFHWVRTPSFVDEMSRCATGASYPAVSDRVVKHSLIPLPPIDEQRRIAAILDAADALRAKRRQALAKLDTLAQAIFIDMFGDPVGNPKGWRCDRVLADVADVRSGITVGRKEPDADQTEVPFLAVVNVQDGYFVLNPLKTINATEREIVRYSLAPGDILLTEGGDPDKLGRGAVWDGSIDPCIHQNHVFRVRIGDTGLQPTFLSWLLGSPRGKRYFLRMAKQTTGIASINMGQLKSFPLLEPPEALQREFVGRIGAIASTKALCERGSDQMDSLFASLQQRAFRGEL